MQFTTPFNELFEDVIQPVCADLGINAYRASDIYRPGVVLQDIIQGLAESNVIISRDYADKPKRILRVGLLPCFAEAGLFFWPSGIPRCPST